MSILVVISFIFLDYKVCLLNLPNYESTVFLRIKHKSSKKIVLNEFGKVKEFKNA